MYDVYNFLLNGSEKHILIYMYLYIFIYTFFRERENNRYQMINLKVQNVNRFKE